MTSYHPDNLQRLEPAYLQKYQLNTAPFAAAIDERFVYLDATRSERLKLLQHYTQFSNMLLIVMGEAGAGKTTLMQHLVHGAPAEWRVCQITANTMMDAEQLLFGAAQGFGLQQLPHDATQLQEMLYARVATLHRQEQIPILIIDDAHALPKDALLAVFHLADAQVDQGNLIRIILCCEPQIERILQARDIRALRERVTHTMEIPPFDEAGTAEYLKHRMAVAGFTGISPFTPRVVKKIHKASQGMPLRINELAHQLLEKDEVPTDDHEADSLPGEIRVKRHYTPMVVITLAAIVIVTALVYQDKINALFEEATTPATQSSRTELTPAPVQPPPQEKIIPLDSPVTPPVIPVAPPTPTDVIVTGEPIEAPGVAPQPAADKIVAEIRSLEPANLEPSTAVQTITINGQGFTRDSQVVVRWSDNAKQLKPEQVKYISANELRINFKTGTKPDSWSVQVIDPQHGKSNPVKFAVGKPPVVAGAKPAPVPTPPVTAKPGELHDEVWIRQQPPQHYTLQLFGTRTHSAAVAFARQHQLTTDVAVFHTLKQNSDWYSVIYGSFANQETAQQASRKLPAELQQAKPWLRRFDSVQQSLKPASTPATAAKPVQPMKPEPAHTPIAQNTAWLWSQDPRHYTLQLLVSQQADNVEKFINRHAVLRAKAVYYRTRSKERDLYTLVYGVYASREQAEAALAQLPAELRAIKPHIRNFASVHAELDTASKPAR